MARVAIIAVAALAVFAGPASAKTFSAQQGDVKATIEYSKTATTRLTIVRNNATLYDAVPSLKPCGGAPCAPSGFKGDPPLRVLDLDGGGEPEVVYSAYSGGAHCCSIAQVYRLNDNVNGYTAIALNFGDPGFDVQDLGGDGRPEFVSRDDAFAYRFTAYAFSGLPILIQRYTRTGFQDVTSAFPALVRKDARLWRGRYNRERKRKDGIQRGPASAWAADQYRLGKRAAALKFLRAEVRRGHLKARFVKNLNAFLIRRGY
jgi:hypothetical protein